MKNNNIPTVTIEYRNTIFYAMFVRGELHVFLAPGQKKSNVEAEVKGRRKITLMEPSEADQVIIAALQAEILKKGSIR